MRGIPLALAGAAAVHATTVSTLTPTLTPAQIERGCTAGLFPPRAECHVVKNQTTTHHVGTDPASTPLVDFGCNWNPNSHIPCSCFFGPFEIPLFCTSDPSDEPPEAPEPTHTERPKPTHTKRPRPTHTSSSAPTPPSSQPTTTRTPEPTQPEPTTGPTETPSPVPTDSPSPVPTETPSPVPTDSPSPVPTGSPSPAPTDSTSLVPTDSPSPAPTTIPSPPTATPTNHPHKNATKSVSPKNKKDDRALKLGLGIGIGVGVPTAGALAWLANVARVAWTNPGVGSALMEALPELGLSNLPEWAGTSIYSYSDLSGSNSEGDLADKWSELRANQIDDEINFEDDFYDHYDPDFYDEDAPEFEDPVERIDNWLDNVQDENFRPRQMEELGDDVTDSADQLNNMLQEAGYNSEEAEQLLNELHADLAASESSFGSTSGASSIAENWATNLANNPPKGGAPSSGSVDSGKWGKVGSTESGGDSSGGDSSNGKSNNKGKQPKSKDNGKDKLKHKPKKDNLRGDAEESQPKDKGKQSENSKGKQPEKPDNNGKQSDSASDESDVRVDETRPANESEDLDQIRKQLKDQGLSNSEIEELIENMEHGDWDSGSNLWSGSDYNVAGGSSSAMDSPGVQEAADVASSGAAADEVADALVQAGVPARNIASTMQAISAATSSLPSQGSSDVGSSNAARNAALEVISNAATPHGLAVSQAVSAALAGSGDLPAKSLADALRHAGVPKRAVKNTKRDVKKAVKGAKHSGSSEMKARKVAFETITRALPADARKTSSGGLVASSDFKEAISQALLNVIGSSYNFWHMYPVAVYNVLKRIEEKGHSKTLQNILVDHPPPEVKPYRDITFPYRRKPIQSHNTKVLPEEDSKGDDKTPSTISSWPASNTTLSHPAPESPSPTIISSDGAANATSSQPAANTTSSQPAPKSPLPTTDGADKATDKVSSAMPMPNDKGFCERLSEDEMSESAWIDGAFVSHALSVFEDKYEGPHYLSKLEGDPYSLDRLLNAVPIAICSINLDPEPVEVIPEETPDAVQKLQTLLDLYSKLVNIKLQEEIYGEEASTTESPQPTPQSQSPTRPKSDQASHTVSSASSSDTTPKSTTQPPPPAPTGPTRPVTGPCAHLSDGEWEDAKNFTADERVYDSVGINTAAVAPYAKDQPRAFHYMRTHIIPVGQCATQLKLSSPTTSGLERNRALYISRLFETWGNAMATVPSTGADSSSHSGGSEPPSSGRDLHWTSLFLRFPDLTQSYGPRCVDIAKNYIPKKRWPVELNWPSHWTTGHNMDDMTRMVNTYRLFEQHREQSLLYFKIHPYELGTSLDILSDAVGKIGYMLVRWGDDCCKKGRTHPDAKDALASVQAMLKALQEIDKEQLTSDPDYEGLSAYPPRLSLPYGPLCDVFKNVDGWQQITTDITFADVEDVFESTFLKTLNDFGKQSDRYIRYWGQHPDQLAAAIESLDDMECRSTFLLGSGMLTNPEDTEKASAGLASMQTMLKALRDIQKD